MHARAFALAAVVALCLTASAAAALDASTSLRFTFVPKRAFQGQPATLSVAVRPTGVRCAAAIRYNGGARQGLGTVRARGGKATWKWKVKAAARVGSARASVSCGRAGRVQRSFSVVGAPSAPARVDVRKNGFSQRVTAASRRVSYGVVLHNPSPENDALKVSVLVNFVDASNRVVDTDQRSIAAVGAGTEYYLGGSTSIPDGSPVSSLEIVVRIGSQAPKRKLSPATSDVLVQESRFDRGWVGAVVGQILNDWNGQLLTRTDISTVVFDSAGNVIGGTSGSTFAPQPPGVRAYFNAAGGANAIPFDRAASASVSVLGSYQAVG